MIAIEANRTVGELVTEKPARAKVFEKYTIDYCCGGRVPLAEACAERGVDVAGVVAELAAYEQCGGEEASIDWAKQPLPELAEHIVITHHMYLREALPRLAALVDKVAGVHGERHPELNQVREIFYALQHELLMHMQKEEVILFPMVTTMVQTCGLAASHCGSVGNPISVMEDEHAFAGQSLEELRRLTGDYQPPADACNSYRVLFDGLAELERDLHTHIHKENNILFPRAIALEAELAG
jgi:regulator of cell morphogenesis and NO signaling